MRHVPSCTPFRGASCLNAHFRGYLQNPLCGVVGDWKRTHGWWGTDNACGSVATVGRPMGLVKLSRMKKETMQRSLMSTF